MKPFASLLLAVDGMFGIPTLGPPGFCRRLRSRGRFRFIHDSTSDPVAEGPSIRSEAVVESTVDHSQRPDWTGDVGHWHLGDGRGDHLPRVVPGSR